MSDTGATVARAAGGHARTNAELHRQLVDAGFTPEDLDLCRRAYRLATRLFTARFRPSHDTFLSHVVGTASILADLGASPRVVAAALLHAAYTEGDFGSGVPDGSPAARAEVRRAVGAGVEEVVARYTAFRWSGPAIADLHARADLPASDREILRMRLANALDDHRDGAILHGADADERRAHVRTSGARLVDLARRIGEDGLAAGLETAFRDTLEGTPLVPRGRPGRGGSYVLPPRSFTPRWRSRARHAARRVARVLGRRLRSGSGA